MTEKVLAHVEEYVGRYAVLASAVLVPLAAALGSLAADLGGADTKVGHAVGLASGAVGSALAVVTWLRGLSSWQVTERIQERSGVTVSVPLGQVDPTARVEPDPE